MDEHGPCKWCITTGKRYLHLILFFPCLHLLMRSPIITNAPLRIMKNPIDRAIRLMTIGAGVVSLIVYAVFQMV